MMLGRGNLVTIITGEELDWPDTRQCAPEVIAKLFE